MNRLYQVWKGKKFITFIGHRRIINLTIFFSIYFRWFYK